MIIEFSLQRTQSNPLTGEMTDHPVWKDAEEVPRIGEHIKLGRAVSSPVFEVKDVIWKSHNIVSVVCAQQPLNKF